MAELEERAHRIAKLNRLGEQGIDAYPADSARTATCADALTHFEEWAEAGRSLTLAGRLKTIRRHGGSLFANLEDGSEALQIFLSRDEVGEEQFDIFAECIDPGDFIEVTGTLFLTKRGERTLAGKSFRVLTKALLPLPEKWHGLSDVEIRYRQRYLDLVANPEIRSIFSTRSLIIKTIRRFFEDSGFMEVETPTLQLIPGGALARPFTTHHHALDTDMYLRVAPELFLKRLIVGGYERVFEFARCFRNEGIDHTHNPEFTMLEAYMAYANYQDIMRLIEELFVVMGKEVFKDGKVAFEDTTISLAGPFPRVSFREAILEAAGLDLDLFPTAKELAPEAEKRGIAVDSTMGKGKIADELYKKFVRATIIQPTFVIDYPVELSPLAKRKTDNPAYVERFQLVMARAEVVNAFSELNDPQDQLARFEDQQKNKEQGDDEAHPIDMDYVTALEHGMPPTGGLGIGIDRLVSLLTNSHSLKEVILFPTLRPKQ